MYWEDLHLEDYYGSLLTDIGYIRLTDCLCCMCPGDEILDGVEQELSKLVLHVDQLRSSEQQGENF